MNPVLWMLAGIGLLVVVAAIAFWCWFLRLDRDLNESLPLDLDANSEAWRVQRQRP